MSLFNKHDKTAYETLSEKDIKDTVENRDVYEDQQLQRSRIEGLQSMTSRYVIMALVATLAAILMWFIVGGFQYGSYALGGTISNSEVVAKYGSEYGYVASDYSYDPSTPYTYVTDVRVPRTDNGNRGGMVTKYQALDADGNAYGDLYDNLEDVPEPDWYVASKTAYEKTLESDEAASAVAENEAKSSFWYWMLPDLWKVLISLATWIVVFGAMYPFMKKNLDAQNLMRDTTDINQYQNDQHIMLPEEIQRKFDYFPDAGAHSNVLVSSMISHMAMQNKGINKVDVSVRADKDILDEDGDIEYLKGEVLLDDDGNPQTKRMPMFDEKFMDDLFEASGAPDDKNYRKYYDATKIPYNPGNKNREKLKGYDTVADLINGDWTLPAYETQRPAGVYVVDTEPVNTMVLAITRAGKGDLALCV